MTLRELIIDESTASGCKLRDDECRLLSIVRQLQETRNRNVSKSDLNLPIPELMVDSMRKAVQDVLRRNY